MSVFGCSIAERIAAQRLGACVTIPESRIDPRIVVRRIQIAQIPLIPSRYS